MATESMSGSGSGSGFGSGSGSGSESGGGSGSGSGSGSGGGSGSGSGSGSGAGSTSPPADWTLGTTFATVFSVEGKASWFPDDRGDFRLEKWWETATLEDLVSMRPAAQLGCCQGLPDVKDALLGLCNILKARDDGPAPVAGVENDLPVLCIPSADGDTNVDNEFMKPLLATGTDDSEILSCLGEPSNPKLFYHPIRHSVFLTSGPDVKLKQESVTRTVLVPFGKPGPFEPWTQETALKATGMDVVVDKFKIHLDHKWVSSPFLYELSRKLDGMTAPDTTQAALGLALMEAAKSTFLDDTTTTTSSTDGFVTFTPVPPSLPPESKVEDISEQPAAVAPPRLPSVSDAASTTEDSPPTSGTSSSGSNVMTSTSTTSSSSSSADTSSSSRTPAAPPPPPTATTTTAGARARPGTEEPAPPAPGWDRDPAIRDRSPHEHSREFELFTTLTFAANHMFANAGRPVNVKQYWNERMGAAFCTLPLFDMHLRDPAWDVLLFEHQSVATKTCRDVDKRVDVLIRRSSKFEFLFGEEAQFLESSPTKHATDLTKLAKLMKSGLVQLEVAMRRCDPSVAVFGVQVYNNLLRIYIMRHTHQHVYAMAQLVELGLPLPTDSAGVWLNRAMSIIMAAETVRHWIECSNEQFERHQLSAPKREPMAIPTHHPTPNKQSNKPKPPKPSSSSTSSTVVMKHLIGPPASEYSGVRFWSGVCDGEPAFIRALASFPDRRESNAKEVQCHALAASASVFVARVVGWAHTVEPFFRTCCLAIALPQLEPMDGWVTTSERAVVLLSEMLQFLTDMEKVLLTHSDLSPTNLMRCPVTNELRVIDWELADVLAGVSPRDPGMGTPGFIAPELAYGPDPVTPSSASDMWSMGLCFMKLVPLEVRKELQASRSWVMDIVWDMVSDDPSGRPDAGSALQALLAAEEEYQSRSASAVGDVKTSGAKASEEPAGFVGPKKVVGDTSASRPFGDKTNLSLDPRSGKPKATSTGTGGTV